MANKVIYLKPLEKDSDSAWFWVHAWKDGGVTQDVEATYFGQDGTDKVYSISVDESVDKIIMIRANPADRTPGSWDSQWNKSGDVSIPQGKNCWTWNNGWDGSTGSWSVYNPPHTVALSSSTGLTFSPSTLTIEDGGRGSTTVSGFVTETEVITITSDGVPFMDFQYDKDENTLTIINVKGDLSLDVVETEEKYSVSLTSSSGLTFTPASFNDITPGDTISTTISGYDPESGYNNIVTITNNGNPYTAFNYDPNTNTLTINVNGNLSLDVSIQKALYDGFYLEVNKEVKPEYKLQPHNDTEEKITLNVNPHDVIELVEVSNGEQTEIPAHSESGATIASAVNIGSEDIEILENCEITVYATISGYAKGKLYVQVELESVNIVYSLDENITASNSAETWPFKEPFSTTLSVAEGYELDYSSVSIVVGTNHFNADSDIFDKSTNTITITDTNGHISITAKSQEEVVIIPGWYFWYEDKNGNTNKILFSSENYDYLEEQQYTIPAEVTDYNTTGGEFRFKVLYKHEDGTESWLSIENSDNWSDLLGSATSGIDAEYGDPTIYMDESYPRYHLYIQKVEDGLGHYWIEQTYPVSLTLTNATSSNTASKTYRWADYTTDISFVGKPNTELLTIKVGGELVDFDSVCTVIENGYMITITKDELGPIEIIAYSEGEEGTEGCWLMTGDGEAIAEMVINPENTEEYYIEYNLIAGQYYSFDQDGSTITLRDFKTADTTGPSGENEYYSGTGVGIDLDVYLNLISLDESKTKLTISKNCVAKIYVRDSGRIWVSIEEEPLSVAGEDFDKISLTNIKHLYLKNNTYYTYPGVHLEFTVSGKSGYSLQSLRVTHNGASNDYTSSSSVNVSIREVLSAVILTPSLVVNEISKKIKLFDQNNSIILYPKTRTDQVVNLVGDNLETVLNRLVERIVALEQALNNN